jgi:uncharacterized protein YoxC
MSETIADAVHNLKMLSEHVSAKEGRLNSVMAHIPDIKQHTHTLLGERVVWATSAQTEIDNTRQQTQQTNVDLMCAKRPAT